MQRSMEVQTKLAARCNRAEWVATPIGQLAQLMVNEGGCISVRLLSIVLNKSRQQVYRWLLVNDSPGRGCTEISRNNVQIEAVTSAIKGLLDSGESISAAHIRQILRTKNNANANSDSAVLPTSIASGEPDFKR